MEHTFIPIAPLIQPWEIEKWADVSTAMLSPRLQELEKIIGLPLTMRLVKKYGGRRIYIPFDPKPKHPIAALIGIDNLVKLSEAYASDGIGLEFSLPKGDTAELALRNARIRAAYAEKTTRQLAAEYNLTQRHVERIVHFGSDAPCEPPSTPRPFGTQSVPTSSLSASIAGFQFSQRRASSTDDDASD